VEKEISDKLQNYLGGGWSCTCGSPFEPKSVEMVSKTKNEYLAHYLCQVCGREQVFTLDYSVEPKLKEVLFRVPTQPISSNDVLDIRKALHQADQKLVKVLSKTVAGTKALLPNPKKS
jgi:hypothetical protein